MLYLPSLVGLLRRPDTYSVPGAAPSTLAAWQQVAHAHAFCALTTNAALGTVRFCLSTSSIRTEPIGKTKRKSPAAGRALPKDNLCRDSDVTYIDSRNGAPEGIRTPNLLIRSQMLYPLSYGRAAQYCGP